MRKLIVKAKLENVSEVINFVSETLNKFKLKSKDKNKALLLSEESFVTLVKSSNENNDVIIMITKNIMNTKIRLKCKGDEIITPTLNVIDKETLEDVSDDSSEEIIRNLIIKNNEDNISSSRKNGFNTISITATEASQKALINSILAILFGIACGFILKFLIPDSITNIIQTYFLVPVKTIFFRAIKLFVAPLIFFSISSSIGSFTDLKELGKIGFKTFKYYMFTSVIAIILSFVIFKIFDFGTFNEFSYLSSGVVAEAQGTISIIDTLISIVPTDIISPFLNMNFLQLIFLAVIVGIAASCLGKTSDKVSTFLNCGNSLFEKIITFIIQFMPLIIVASVSDLIISLNVNEAKSIFTLLLFIALTNVLMIIVYQILVFIGAKKNPFVFLKKTLPAWLNSVAISSSNAAMPFTMKICDNLKISPKLYSFSIPLGATINMDGVVVILVLSLFYFTKSFGVVLTANDIMQLFATSLILSMAAPGVPGLCLVLLSILFNMFGVPQEALTLFVGINAFVDPIATGTNVMGDIAGTYVTACKNNMIVDDDKNKNKDKDKD